MSFGLSNRQRSMLPDVCKHFGRAKKTKAKHSGAEPQPKNEGSYRRDAECAEKFVVLGEEIWD